MQTPYEELTEAQKFQLWKLATSICNNVKNFESTNPSAQTLTEYGSNMQYIVQSAVTELMQIGIDDELQPYVSMYSMPPVLDVQNQQIVRINVV